MYMCWVKARQSNSLPGYALVLILGALFEHGMHTHVLIQGDGVSDDGAALDRALLNLTQGGMLFFPPGAYALSRPLVVSSMYAVRIVGSGAAPPGCHTAGTTLVATTANSSLIVLDKCTFCSVEHMSLTQAWPAATYTEGCRSASFAVCAKSRQSYAIAMQRGRRRHHGQQQSNPTPPQPVLPKEPDGVSPCFASQYPPTSGAAILVSGSFQTTLTSLWISQVWIALKLNQRANTITLLDSQISDVYGPAAVLCAGVGDGDGGRVDILQISRLTTNQINPAANKGVVWVDIAAGT